MLFDRMTIKLQEAITASQSLAEKENRQAIDCEHLLLFEDRLKVVLK